jgi:heme o synthase
MQQARLLSEQKFRDYYYVTKPNVISLLVFTGAASYVASAGWKTSILTLIAVSAAVWLGSAAANTIGSYFDRDIDAIMARTRKRPIPTGRIPAKHAAVYGLALLVASMGLSLLVLSELSAISMLIGFLDYTVVYSFLLKRRTPLNIILGGFSGVMPVLVGYFAVPNPVIPLTAALFAGFLVFFWIPEHIWALAIRFKKDYENAKIPMLPAIASEIVSVRLVAITSIIMVAYSLFPAFYTRLGFHLIYLGFAAVLGAAILALNFWLLKNPSAERAWTVFKFSSPYLFFIFIGIMLDVLLYTR